MRRDTKLILLGLFTHAAFFAMYFKSPSPERGFATALFFIGAGVLVWMVTSTKE